MVEQTQDQNEYVSPFKKPPFEKIQDALLKYKDMNISLKQLLCLALRINEREALWLCKKLNRHESLKICFIDFKEAALKIGEYYQ